MKCSTCQSTTNLFVCMHCLECHCVGFFASCHQGKQRSDEDGTALHSTTSSSSSTTNNNHGNNATLGNHMASHLKRHFESSERVQRLQAVRAKIQRPLCSVFAVSLQDGALFCYDCKDLIWDKDFVAANEEERSWMSTSLDHAFYGMPSICLRTLSDDLINHM